MIEFQRSLPEAFRERLSMKVVTMAERNKVKNKSDIVEFYNTEFIFSRVMYLLGVDQIKLESVFNYELAPVPTSMFKDTGDPRFTTTKSVLKNKLKVEVSSPNINPDTVVIDGGGLLPSDVDWPKDRIVQDFVDGVINYIFKILRQSDIYLIFDRYIENSIKSGTRLKRIGNFNRTHKHSLETP